MKPILKIQILDQIEDIKIKRRMRFKDKIRFYFDRNRTELGKNKIILILGALNSNEFERIQRNWRVQKKQSGPREWRTN